MAEMLLEKYKGLVAKHLDDRWTPKEGYTAEELADQLAAADLPAGASLPLALEEFYRAVGRCEELMEAHCFFFDPDELVVEDGHLLFLEDEDEKFAWGVPVEALDVPDPLVRRRANSTGAWHDEDATVGEFILDLLDFSFEEE